MNVLQALWVSVLGALVCCHWVRGCSFQLFQLSLHGLPNWLTHLALNLFPWGLYTASIFSLLSCRFFLEAIKGAQAGLQGCWEQVSLHRKKWRHLITTLARTTRFWLQIQPLSAWGWKDQLLRRTVIKCQLLSLLVLILSTRALPQLPSWVDPFIIGFTFLLFSPCSYLSKICLLTTTTTDPQL